MQPISGIGEWHKTCNLSAATVIGPLGVWARAWLYGDAKYIAATVFPIRTPIIFSWAGVSGLAGPQNPSSGARADGPG